MMDDAYATLPTFPSAEGDARLRLLTEPTIREQLPAHAGSRTSRILRA